jgi:psiF repeat
MKRIFALALVGLFACGSVYAADTKTDAMKTDAKKTDAMNSQQDKMKACNEQAADKKGDERKAFMKTCLSAKPAPAKSKMAMCNEKTKGMTKEEAGKARSECMKG